MARILSSFEKFSKAFPNAAESKGDARLAALKIYFARGGVISVGKGAGNWPRLIYPSPLRVRQQISTISSLRGNYLGKRKDWHNLLQQARTYELRHNILKLSSPLFWKHVTKCIVDIDYRNDANAVKLPAHLVTDNRWKPMVKEFLDDVEYRKQLVETVQNSIVYSKNRRVARYAKELQAFRMGVSSKKIVEIDKKLSELDEQVRTLQIIMDWARN